MAGVMDPGIGMLTDCSRRSRSVEFWEEDLDLLPRGIHFVSGRDMTYEMKGSWTTWMLASTLNKVHE